MFDTRKATALLAYLAVTGRQCRREALAALCWPDADRERASASLRRTLSTIRRIAGADVLRSEGGAVALDRACVQTDVGQARSLLTEVRAHSHSPTAVCQDCLAPLTRVADLHRGPFLEGFALRDSPQFDDWQFVTAEELRSELADALSRLTDAYIMTGDLEAASRAARRRLTLDPLHEPAHRTLMRLYAWQGRRDAALRQYRECVRVLQAELGVPPLVETTRLYNDVVADRVVSAAPVNRVERVVATTAAEASPVQGGSQPGLARRLAPGHDARPRQRGRGRQSERPPLVARDAEVTAVRDALAGVGTGGCVVLVEGEAGIGKTRLLEEVLAASRSTDQRILQTSCLQDETGMAYGVVAHLLRSALREAADDDWLTRLRPDTLREVGRLLPEIASHVGPAPAIDGPGAAWRLVDALATTLVAAVSTADATNSGVLVIDDAHWMDESSLDVVAHLAHHLDGGRVCLVVTWRSELVGRWHRLRRLMADLERTQPVTRIRLDRLDAAAVHTLITRALGPGHRDLATLSERIMVASEGVPLLVVEYLAAVAIDPAALDGPPPRGARDLLRARLSGIGPTALQVLTTAAVVGRAFDPDLARRASGRTEEETAAALDELGAAGLIAERDDGTAVYDFTHARLRALVYHEIGLARQRLLHRRVAEALESRVRQADVEHVPAAAIAAHYVAAGDGQAAARWMARAAAHAADLLATTEAVAHYEEALALGHPERGRINEALGDLHTLSGRYGDALERYEAAAAVADDERFAPLEHKIAGVHLRWGQWVLADQHLGIALRALEGHETSDALAQRARILTDRGLLEHRQGHQSAAGDFAREALAVAERTEDLGAIARAHNLLGVLSKHDLSLARYHLEHALALARRLRDVGAEVAAANNLAQAHAAAGAVDRALPLAQAALSRARMVADRHREAALHNNLADLLRAAGRTDEAMTHLKQAVALFAEVGNADDHAPEVWKLAVW